MANCRPEKKKTPWYESLDGDFSLDVIRVSEQAIQQTEERKIPVKELYMKRSHINAYIDKVVTDRGLVVTTFPRQLKHYQLPKNGKRFTFPRDDIGRFIGKQGVNIKQIQAEHGLKALFFNKEHDLIAISLDSTYDWTQLEKIIEASRRQFDHSQSQENIKRFRFPKEIIGRFIGKYHANINHIKDKHGLRELYFRNDILIAVAPSSDYNWTKIENVVQRA